MAMTNTIDELPLDTIEEMIEKSNTRIEQFEDKLSHLKQELTQEEARLHAEQVDLDLLKKSSLSNFILKIKGEYEAVTKRETDDVIKQKLVYDKLVLRIEDYAQKLKEEKIKFADLRNSFLLRGGKLMGDEQTPQSFVSSKNAAKPLRIEIEEAYAIGRKIISLIKDIIASYSSARSWATYDIWAGSGILAHGAKYSHIDKAENNIIRLNHLLEDYESELEDIEPLSNAYYNEFSSTLRAIDFFFDNIFTDISVRGQIDDNINSLKKLDRQIRQIQSRLENEIR